MIKCIKMYFKKRRLIKKYTPTTRKMTQDVIMMQMAGDDSGFKIWYVKAHVYPQLRCLNRLKRL